MRNVIDEAIKTAKYSFYGGIAFFLLMLVFAFITESTFGQRCANEGNQKGSAEWRECVSDLASGRKT